MELQRLKPLTSQSFPSVSNLPTLFNTLLQRGQTQLIRIRPPPQDERIVCTYSSYTVGTESSAFAPLGNLPLPHAMIGFGSFFFIIPQKNESSVFCLFRFKCSLPISSSTYFLQFLIQRIDQNFIDLLSLEYEYTCSRTASFPH